MPDQLETMESQLYDRAFPERNPRLYLASLLGEVLQAPVADIPTVEDVQREQGQIGIPTPAHSAQQTGEQGLDYLGAMLGPLMALLTSQQYARQKTGKPAQTWGQQSDYTKANSPLEQLRNWARTRPWENRPPEGESAWTYRQPPPIGGPTGRGQTPADVRAAIEKARFQGMLKQIREQEAREAPRPPAPRPAGSGRQIDDDKLDWMIQQMWKQGGREPGGPFQLPPLPGDE